MNEWTLYIAAKFAAYAAWSALGLAFLSAPRPAPARLAFESLGFGLMRLLLGMGFGFLVFLFSSALPIHGTGTDYVAIYAPVRVIEWGILLRMMRRGPNAAVFGDRRAWIWIVLGIAVSFAVDALSPIPMHERFCIGRCLC